MRTSISNVLDFKNSTFYDDDWISFVDKKSS